MVRHVTLAELDGNPLISRGNISLVKDGDHHLPIMLG